MLLVKCSTSIVAAPFVSFLFVVYDTCMRWFKGSSTVDDVSSLKRLLMLISSPGASLCQLAVCVCFCVVFSREFTKQSCVPLELGGFDGREVPSSPSSSTQLGTVGIVVCYAASTNCQLCFASLCCNPSRALKRHHILPLVAIYAVECTGVMVQKEWCRRLGIASGRHEHTTHHLLGTHLVACR